MYKKGVSFFIVGILVGIVVSTFGFAWFVRLQNLASGQQQQSEQVIIKLAHGLDQFHPVHKGMEVLAQRAAELSGGLMKVEIYPNGQLGSETETVEQLQHGGLDIAKVSAAVLESFIPEMSVFSIPYIFRDQEHYWRVLDGPLGREMLLVGQRVGMRGLCYYDSGSRNFYTVSKPILTPDDLKGQKIRTMKSATAMEIVTTLGGAATPISWGELYTALQQKMVDGAENNPPSFFSNRHYEVCKHFSMDEHTRIPDVLLISNMTWDRLSPQQQLWLQQAAEESCQYQKKLWNEKTAEALQEMQKYGVKIYYPDKKPFEKKVEPMYEQYKGTKTGQLLDRIRKTE